MSGTVETRTMQGPSLGETSLAEISLTKLVSARQSYSIKTKAITVHSSRN